MQHVIKYKQKQGLPVTGLDLLKVVQPNLATYYEKALRDFPTGQEEAVLNRFNAVTKGLYTFDNQQHRKSTVPSNRAISTPFRKTAIGIKEVLDTVKKTQYSPTQAAAYLNKIKAQSLDEIKEALLACDKASTTAFQALAIRHQLQLFKELVKAHTQKSLTNEQCIHLLQAITDIPFHELNLSPFNTVLTDKLLVAHFKKAGAHLLSLNLTGCRNITNASLLQLATLCPNLIHLKLNAISHYRSPSVFYHTAFTVLKGNFQKLITLELNGCSQLTTINIIAPGLKSSKRQCLHWVATHSNTKFSTLQTAFPLASCLTLEDAGIRNLCAYNGAIQYKPCLIIPKLPVSNSSKLILF